MRLRPLRLGALLLRFVTHAVLAGVTTMRIIVQRSRPGAGFVRLRFAPMSEGGAAILGAMITLTPGSSVIDIDMDRREVLIHLLDVAHADAAVAAIRRDFERHIAVLFPPEET